MINKEYSDRAYVVCHMISSIDGKIDGDFLEMKEIKPIRDYANQIREQLNCSAVIFGAETIIKSFGQRKVAGMQATKNKINRNDYIAQTEVNSFFISIDPSGKVLWENKYIEKRGCPKSHVIEVLIDSVSDGYIEYLREHEISYIFAGKNELDCKLLLEKLKQKFGIDRTMLSGGGITNWSFMKENMIDELSVIICPMVDGTRNSATLFDNYDNANCKLAQIFTVDNLQTTPGNGLWLVYHPKK